MVVGDGLVGGRVRCLVVVVAGLVVLIIIVGGGDDGEVGGTVETVVDTCSTIIIAQFYIKLNYWCNKLIIP